MCYRFTGILELGALQTIYANRRARNARHKYCAPLIFSRSCFIAPSGFITKHKFEEENNTNFKIKAWYGHCEVAKHILITP
jgi:hypothetical protein